GRQEAEQALDAGPVALHDPARVLAGLADPVPDLYGAQVVALAQLDEALAQAGVRHELAPGQALDRARRDAGRGGAHRVRPMAPAEHVLGRVVPAAGEGVLP